MRTIKIALTGGIGSGKTTVANYFSELGIFVIDADKIVHDLTKPGSKNLQKIITHFKNDKLSVGGKLDRTKLREIIFSNPKEKAWLENLLHPLVLKEMQKEIRQVKSPYCILVIPLLFETKTKGFKNICDRILVVDTTTKNQIARIMNRNKISTKQAKTIIANQTNRTNRLRYADDVIINNGALNELKDQVIAIHHKYSTREFTINSPQAMRKFGANLADYCKKMEKESIIIYLSGDLGAGKTTLVRGFLKKLGYAGKVKSPTFTIVEPYNIDGQIVYHFDLYRLNDPAELEYIGAHDYFKSKAITLIEWPEKAATALPNADIRCKISMAPKGRRVEMKSEV